MEQFIIMFNSERRDNKAKELNKIHPHYSSSMDIFWFFSQLFLEELFNFLNYYTTKKSHGPSINSNF